MVFILRRRGRAPLRVPLAVHRPRFLTMPLPKASPAQGFRPLHWLPLAILVVILLALAAAPIGKMLFATDSAPFRQSSLVVGNWQMVASAASGDAGRITVLIGFGSLGAANGQQPPWPQVSAVMAGHPMTISAPAAPDGPNAFRAELTASMPGEWTIAIRADGQQLTLPVTAP